MIQGKNSHRHNEQEMKHYGIQVSIVWEEVKDSSPQSLLALQNTIACQVCTTWYYSEDIRALDQYAWPNQTSDMTLSVRNLFIFQHYKYPYHPFKTFIFRLIYNENFCKVALVKYKLKVRCRNYCPLHAPHTNTSTRPAPPSPLNHIIFVFIFIPKGSKN